MKRPRTSGRTDGQDAGERARLTVEHRVRLEEAVASYQIRRDLLERRIVTLRRAARPTRRAAAAMAGSRAWDLLSRLPSLRSDRVATDAVLERERRAFYRVARRAETLERGLGAPLSGVRQRVLRRRPARSAPHPRGSRDGPGDDRIDVLVQCSPRRVASALRALLACRGRARRVRLVPELGPPGQRLSRAVARSRGRVVMVVSAGAAPSRALVHRLVARLLDEPSLGAVFAGSGGWQLDWRHGVPRVSSVPAPSDFPDGSCLAVRRAARNPDAFSGYRSSLRALELSLSLNHSGLDFARVGGLPPEPALASTPADDIRTLLEREGPKLRQRALRALLSGEGRPLRVFLEEATELEGACRSLGWSPADDADVALGTGEGGHLVADWIRAAGSYPAALAVDTAAVARNPEVLRGALLGTLERPSLWVRTARTGGDRILAASLCRELASLGHTVLLDAGETDDLRGACLDAALAIQGWALPDPHPGQLNVVWQISHPEAVSPAELDRYGYVLVASYPEAARLGHVLRAPVEVMLQFADPKLFFPEPDPAYENELLFVGNWRGVFRRVVWDALAAGLEPALYGRGWERLAPEHARGEEVTPDELRRLYSSCAILLADHWDDMRARGFLANRVYDALACEAFIVCDQVAGVDAELDGAVETYSDPRKLREKVERWLARPDARRERARRGRELVLRHHTAAHRARQLLTAIERISAGTGQSGGARSGGDSGPRA